MIREGREETGLAVTVRRLVGVYFALGLQVVRYPDNVWHSVNVCYECVTPGGALATRERPLALPRLRRTLLPNHRIRIRDARSRRVAAFVR